MITFKLDKLGFIKNWLTTGKKEEFFTAPDFEKVFGDQIEYEQTLRTLIYSSEKTAPTTKAKMGDESALGTVWHYYYNHGNNFVDYSRFYSLLSKIETDLQTYIISETEKEIDAVLWAYESVEVWLNGELVAENQTPVYKPIKQIKFKMQLKAGENWLYLKTANLGVRDTRNIVGVQLLDTKNLCIALENSPAVAFAKCATEWLQTLCCDGATLRAPQRAEFDCFVTANGEKIAFSGNEITLASDIVEFSVTACDKASEYTRKFEIHGNRKPAFYTDRQKSALDDICKHIAQEPFVVHGTGDNMAVFNVLARCFYDTNTALDDEYLLSDLALVEKRIDCADFIFVALIRMQKLYGVSEPVAKRMKEVLLNFRYWMDEKGSDGMCFWSENHALMFYTAQALSGELYADDLFVRSNRLGKEQAEVGYARCRQWLDSVEEEGLEEFNSATYMLVTIAALLNLVDFAPKELAERATDIMDLILRQFARHIFKQSIISPQGRVYRDVIFPPMQSAQSLLNLIFADYPHSGHETMWLSLFLTTSYKFPADLAEIAEKDYDENYTSAYARIHIKKNKDYMLTSAQSPREKDDLPKWENLCFTENPDKGTNAYVKSLNERFHGTSFFRAGAYGYQQHLWYAALTNECVVFATNPGSYVDCDGMRPGYWYGNLSLPAVRQNKNELLSIFSLEDKVQTKYTHVFWPTAKFDEVIVEKNWLFGKCETGLIALWCSGELEAHNDVLQGCEYRCYDLDVAYACTCASVSDEGTLAEFAQKMKQNTPSFNKAELTASTKNNSLIFVREYDATQEL